MASSSMASLPLPSLSSLPPLMPVQLSRTATVMTMEDGKAMHLPSPAPYSGLEHIVTAAPAPAPAPATPVRLASSAPPSPTPAIPPPSLELIWAGTQKGGKAWNEDSHFRFASPSRRVLIAGVLDGHGGINGRTASIEGTEVAMQFFQTHAAEMDSWAAERWQTELHRLFGRMHDGIREKLRMDTTATGLPGHLNSVGNGTPTQRYVDEKGVVRIPGGDPIHGGTTCTIVVTMKNATTGDWTVITANVGDSFAVLLPFGTATKPGRIHHTLTVDHGPDTDEEYARVQALPAAQYPHKLIFIYDLSDKQRKYDCPKVYRSDGVKDPIYVSHPWDNGLRPTNVRYEPAVYAVSPPGVYKDGTCLAMTRALGDFYAHPMGLTWQPSISIRRLPSSVNHTVLVASDGLWDCWRYDELALFWHDLIFTKNLPLHIASATLLEENTKRATASFGAKNIDDTSLACWQLINTPPPAPVALPPSNPTLTSPPSRPLFMSTTSSSSSSTPSSSILALPTGRPLMLATSSGNGYTGTNSSNGAQTPVILFSTTPRVPRPAMPTPPPVFSLHGTPTPQATPPPSPPLHALSAAAPPPSLGQRTRTSSGSPTPITFGGMPLFSPPMMSLASGGSPTSGSPAAATTSPSTNHNTFILPSGAPPMISFTSSQSSSTVLPSMRPPMTTTSSSSSSSTTSTAPSFTVAVAPATTSPSSSTLSLISHLPSSATHPHVANHHPPSHPVAHAANHHAVGHPPSHPPSHSPTTNGHTTHHGHFHMPMVTIAVDGTPVVTAPNNNTPNMSNGNGHSSNGYHSAIVASVPIHINSSSHHIADGIPVGTAIPSATQSTNSTPSSSSSSSPSSSPTATVPIVSSNGVASSSSSPSTVTATSSAAMASGSAAATTPSSGTMPEFYSFSFTSS